MFLILELSYINGCLFKHESNKNDLSWGLNKQGGRSGTVDTA